MKTTFNIAIASILVLCFLTNALPCGPSYTTPVFENENAPENPYSGFAAGRLGIVSPKFRRSLLLAVYRYVNGGNFTPDEQKELVELWKAQIDHDYAQTDELGDALKAWVEKRKDVMGKEDKLPAIYAERSYGGYDFFPNCTKNAFETATETLSDRISGHSASDPNVVDWVKAQDQVFGNCSSGRQMPDDPPIGAADWLQKDRAYQKAAAAFYSLSYSDAKRRFDEIAQDTASPWSETADYLVARTLIREASLSNSTERSAPLYEEAEKRLQRFLTGTGKFAASAARLDGLIAYRLRPKERVVELGRKIGRTGSDENFKQDLIDYTWLLDKFESQTLTAEDKRKEDEARRADPANAANSPASNQDLPIPANTRNPDEITINVYLPDYSKSWTVNVKADATDDEAIAAAEKAVGSPLTDEMKKNVREMRRSGYADRFSKNRQPDYEGGYYGDSKLTPSLLPDFLKSDDLTNWLFVYQMNGPEAYLYSLKRFRESGSELWLMTALTKAEKASTDVGRLLDAAEQANRTAPGYLTIVYHAARLYLELGRNAEARKLIDTMVTAGDDIPVSVQNQFRGLRLRLAADLDEYLTYSLRRPYAFDFGGTIGSVDDLIAEQKKYYDPEYNKDGREAFDREVEDSFKDERLWQDRMMLDSSTIEMMNSNFPQSVLLQVERSPALPDYLRPKFAIAIWTRAYLLDDYTTMVKMTSEIIKYAPEFQEPLMALLNSKTPAAMKNATLFFILKNPLYSPYLEDGMGKADNEFGQWDANDWWCSSYMADADASAEEVSGVKPVPPSFLTAAQKQAASVERKKLIGLGDAPQLLANRVLAWAARSPSDERVPEALYIVHQANGWTKYGCGNNEELQKQISDLMNKRYPNNGWTRKLTEEDTEK